MLLRFPDIHENHVVFTYGGDLWQASTSGGAAIRLTAHSGLELFAKYSPDGKSIAALVSNHAEVPGRWAAPVAWTSWSS